MAEEEELKSGKVEVPDDARRGSWRLLRHFFDAYSVLVGRCAPLAQPSLVTTRL